MLWWLIFPHWHYPLRFQSLPACFHLYNSYILVLWKETICTKTWKQRPNQWCRSLVIYQVSLFILFHCCILSWFGCAWQHWLWGFVSPWIKNQGISMIALDLLLPLWAWPCRKEISPSQVVYPPKIHLNSTNLNNWGVDNLTWARRATGLIAPDNIRTWHIYG